MTTKAKPKAVKAIPGKKEEATPKRRHSEAYDAALAEYVAAVELLWKGAHEEARGKFLAVAKNNPDEIALAERARTYALVCSRRGHSPEAQPATPEDCYNRGVFLANDGRLDEAAALLDRAVTGRQDEASYLYARAAVRALQGNADGAALDLKKAIHILPHLRFQAANDPDFERVRDEAVFIDVIEPTHAGA